VAHQLVLILDFGSQYTQLIARRIREHAVYCEVHPHHLSLERIRARWPVAVVLSGGPSSCTTPTRPRSTPASTTSGVPMLGICYGAQLTARSWAATSARRTSASTGAPWSGCGPAARACCAAVATVTS
jgi:GMP synthase (glutamine-hydrolysing)